MPISNTESLILLIRSLSKAEKRSFKLYARRNQDGKDSLFVQLFEMLEKNDSQDELITKRKLGGLSTTAYSNLKKHLFEQLMISLRLIQKEKKDNFKIREYIDFAYVLYGKGLHMQALDVLKKAKQLSRKHFNDFSLLTILELEKLIQSRHITRSKSEPISELIEETSVLGKRVSQRIMLSNVRLNLHSQYLKKGHVESKDEEYVLRENLKKYLSDIDEPLLEGIERIHYYQSYVWYYYILDSFDQCKVWALKWVEAFKQSEELQKRDIDLFMRGYHYALTACFNIKDVNTLESLLTELEDLRQQNYKKLNLNSQIVSFQYVHNGRMNLHFLRGTFEEGMKNIPNTISRINRYASKLDYHKVMIIYYKVAWMHIGAGLPERSIKYLDYIISLTDKSLREDIQCYARLMKLLAVYDQDNYNLVIELADEFSLYLNQMKHSNRVQSKILTLMKDVAGAPVLERNEIFKKNLEKLILLKENIYERRAFVYLDILPWLISKIKKISIGEVIQSR